MIQAILEHPRYRSVLAAAMVMAASVLAGHAIYTGQRRFLAILALFTLVVLLRRAAFTDFYLLALACTILSHVRIGFIKDEFEQDKWLALFLMGVVALLAAGLSVPRLQWPRLIHFLVLALVILAAYSVSWSLQPWLSFQKAGVFAVGMIVAFIGAWSWATDSDRVRRVIDVHVDSLWLVFPLSMVVLVLPIGGKFQGPGRFYSIFENANNLGCWASLSLPLLFGLALTHPVPWRRRVAALMLVTGAACVFLAGSRGGTLGASGGIAFYCLMRWPRRTVAAGVLAGIGVAFLLLYEVDFSRFSGRLYHLLRPDSLVTMSDRTISWEVAKLIVAERPWFGHGFGLSDGLFPFYGIEYFPGHSPPTMGSTYVETYANSGRIGLALLLGVQGLACWAGFRTWWRDKTGPTGLLALAVVATVISASAHGVVEMIFFSMGNPWSLPFWVSLAMLVKLDVVSRRERSARAPIGRPAAVSPVVPIHPTPAPA